MLLQKARSQETAVPHHVRRHAVRVVECRLQVGESLGGKLFELELGKEGGREGGGDG